MKVINKVQGAFLIASALAGIAGAHAVEKPKATLAMPTVAGKSSRPVQLEEMVPGLMIKPRARGGEKLAFALDNRDPAELSRIAGARLSVFRKMSGGAHVVRLAKPVSLSEARAMAVRLMQQGGAEMAEPDRIMKPLFTPNDPRYATQQWHYQAPSSSNLGGANLPRAWDITKGTPSVVVAVLDTGIRLHEDIDSTAILPGYDFITNFSSKAEPRANDGNGRDPDATDPGDFATVEDFCYDRNTPSLNNSSWHGTHVAGTIVASMNNQTGGTGIAPNVKLQPVRVLGTCGGLLSDIIDGMRWAAGVGSPANSTPARVLNLSLGGTSGPCSAALQNAVDDVIATGAVIVAATGNENVIDVLQPANCKGVIAVTAHSIDADTTTYANIGPETSLSAPGGGCGETNDANGRCRAGNSVGILSTINAGTTTPSSGTNAYDTYTGTSMAAPHVAGVAALMLSRNPSLTPSQVKAFLQTYARPFPAMSACVGNPEYVNQCGAGLLDAEAAVVAAAVTAANPLSGPPQLILVTPDSVVSPTTQVVLTATAIPSSANTLASYQWVQLTGQTVALTNANTQNASFTAPATGTLSFQVTATDSAGQSSIAAVTIRVNSLPVSTLLPAQSVPAGQTLNVNLLATDADGDAINYSLLSAPDGPTIDPVTGLLTWNTAAPAGTYVLTYAVSDQYGSTQGSVTVNVTQSKSGGGGSMHGGILIAFVAMAAARRMHRSRKWTEHARGR